MFHTISALRGWILGRFPLFWRIQEGVQISNSVYKCNLIQSFSSHWLCVVIVLCLRCLFHLNVRSFQHPDHNNGVGSRISGNFQPFRIIRYSSHHCPEINVIPFLLQAKYTIVHSLYLNRILFSYLSIWVRLSVVCPYVDGIKQPPNGQTLSIGTWSPFTECCSIRCDSTQSVSAALIKHSKRVIKTVQDVHCNRYTIYSPFVKKHAYRSYGCDTWWCAFSHFLPTADFHDHGHLDLRLKRVIKILWVYGKAFLLAIYSALAATTDSEVVECVL